MWIVDLPPFLPFFIGAIIALLLPPKLRPVFMLLIPVWGGLNLFFTHSLSQGVNWQLMGFTLELMNVDKLSVMFGYLFHIAAFLALLFALHVKDPLQQIASLLYAGSALGAVFSGDLLSLFLFWELLALTSVWLVLARRTDRATRAAMRYLLLQVLSGVLLLAGALLHYRDTGSLSFDHIGLSSVASWLLFIAFGIKAAFPGLHTWLTDAYPEATATGTVFLSAFTTKVAIFALARCFAGTELLIYIGAAMTCFPIFYAVIENDLRKVLAYSLINQLGFMVCGIGIGTALALNGAVAHAFNDVIFKGLLFMTMGAVLHRVGHVLGSDLGGLHKTMPRTTMFCIVGAASISAFPLFSGFVSKSMVMAALIEQGHDILWLMLLFASAGVFHHAGIKIPFFAFFAHDSGLRPKEAPLNMQLAMFGAAVLCIAIGSNPQWLYQLLPWENSYVPYDLTHTLTQLQLLFFSALAFVWLNKQGMYPPELRSVNLDMEWFYRRLLPATATRVRGVVSTLWCGLRDWVMDHWHAMPQMSPSSSYSAAQLTRRMAAVLAILLLLSYLSLP
ncbi:Na(+)/H(+) antiporter subunit D [Aestuariibacter halophilus]|uniref:Na(+)/H(+) antiporter subunit D n=1 Tax=Fluctibacter halophilus TaxID=226011 RepID=A0ABS8G8Z1_9ALTE|nr:Na(+)/H(+) antiporter subunit D [Aestuariibacter halophilus]MCC2616275.1 Na(+)/H(+) antiporter subunit D [Aestuariibacter halophilus]